MRLLFTCLVTILLRSPLLAQTVPDGLLMDDADYLRLPRKAPSVVRRGLLNLPPAVSYESVCPKPLDQGPHGTCLAVVLGYYIRTIMEARRLGLTNPDRINELAFSPSYIYQEAKNPTDYACAQGLSITRAVRVIEQQGVVPLRVMGYPACGQSTNQLGAQAQPYRIAQAQQILDLDNPVPDRITRLKTALTEGQPVMVSFFASPAFHKLTGPHWTPSAGDRADLQQRLDLFTKQKNTGRAHALCVLGYDDTRYGGAFRVVNSTGKNWGENGFCWIRYADLASFTRYALQLYPRLSNTSTQTMQGLAVELAFNQENGQPMPVRYDAVGSQTAGMPVYRMTRQYDSGTAFKISISNSQQTHLYAFGVDDRPDSDLTRLYPYTETIDGVTVGYSSLLGPGASVSYPPSSSIELDNIPGTDYLLLLFASREQPAGQLEIRLKQLTGASVLHRFRQLFKPGEVAAHQPITDQLNVRVLPANTGSLLPVLVLIEHQ